MTAPANQLWTMERRLLNVLHLYDLRGRGKVYGARGVEDRLNVEPALRTYDPNLPLFFLHVPKTGGTSLRTLFEEWFPEKVLHHYRPVGAAPPRHTPGPGTLVAGHFNRLRGFGLQTYYPGAQQFVTVLRDPFDRLVSQWLFIGARYGSLHNYERDMEGFDTWFKRRLAAFERGQDDFSVFAQLPGDQGELSLGFVAVGVVERMEDTVRLIARKLGRSAPSTLPYENRTGGNARQFEPWRSRHRAAFEPEYRIYEHAVLLLETGLAADG